MHVVTRIWKQQPGKYFFISTKDRAGKWEDHPFSRRSFKDVIPFIENNSDKDIYWCPHGFDKKRRLRKYAEPPQLLYADLDEVDPREIELTPTIAWESSPGRFVGLWLLDGLMSEDLNRDLTYAIGADKGGWDLTQVLRVPGTKNFKYAATPKVRMLWMDGPGYTIDDLKKKVSKKRTKKGDKNTARVIYKKYLKRLGGFVRRELFKGKPKEGKRSEVLWRLANELCEAGMSLDEAFEVLRVSPWNKFKTRRDGDEQLRRELNKIIDKDFDDDTVVGEDDPDDYASDDEEERVWLGRSMEDVEEEQMNWIWYPYLARGEVTILEGDPGLGKSYLAQMICKGIVDGERMPSVKRRRVKNGKVIYFDVENAAGTVTKKRLVANGCKNLSRYFQEEEPFTVDDDEAVEEIYEAVEKIRPTIVVFDTVNTYIGKADTHKAAEVTQSFNQFRDIARRFDCSVLVLRHLTKGGRDRALYRGQGSIAFAALARFVLTVGRSPDDPDTRVMAVTKINVAKPPRALTFRIEGLKDTIKEKDRSVFTWGEFVDLSSDDIIAPQTAKATGDKTNDAEDLLRDLLDDGPVDYKTIQRSAEARSVSKSTLLRAKDTLGVIVETKGFGKNKKSMWSFPDPDDQTSEQAQKGQRRKKRD